MIHAIDDGEARQPKSARRCSEGAFKRPPRYAAGIVSIAKQ
jgi:hypothetical protein